jgi:hypothetical protein
VVTGPVAHEVLLALTDLAIRYGTAIDRRDWALFRTCFTEDCLVDYGPVGTWQGLEPFTRAWEDIHAQVGRSLHRITNVSAGVAGAGAAMSSYVDAVVLGPDNLSGTRSIGCYDDDVVTAPDGWRIARRTFTMVHLTADIGAPLGLSNRTGSPGSGVD